MYSKQIILASFSILSLTVASLFSEDVSLSRISPRGKQFYEEQKDKFPPFDNDKYQKEAELKYPLTKIGEQITIVTRRNTYTGKFGGMKGNSIIIGEKALPTVDIPPDDIIKYSEELNKKKREEYISKFKNEYNRKLIEYREKLKEEIYLQYPATHNAKLNFIFSKITDNEKKQQYITAYKKFHQESLPLKNKTIDELEAEVNQKLISQFSELCLADGLFWNKAEKEALEKKLREIARAKIDRAQNRILMPQTSSPVFEPDGGIFDSNVPIKIICATDATTIYYTIDGSEPSELSLQYTEPVLLKKPMTLKALAIHPEYRDSEISIISPWAGGVYVSYFDTMTFRGKAVERVEPEIAFKSGGKTPIKDQIPDHLFSIIWAGQIIPKASGEYEFFLTTDDGARMWLGDLLLIDAWKEQPPTEYKKKFTLEAGKKYDFKIAFTEVMGFAECILEWQTNSISRQVIPQECFSPEGKYVNELKKWNKKIMQGSEEIYPNRQSMKNPGEFMGIFKLPVKGGQARWDQLGIK